MVLSLDQLVFDTIHFNHLAFASRLGFDVCIKLFFGQFFTLYIPLFIAINIFNSWAI